MCSHFAMVILPAVYQLAYHIIWLVGQGHPSEKNITQYWDDEIPKIWENINVPNHQPVILVRYYFSILLEWSDAGSCHSRKWCSPSSWNVFLSISRLSLVEVDVSGLHVLPKLGYSTWSRSGGPHLMGCSVMLRKQLSTPLKCSHANTSSNSTSPCSCFANSSRNLWYFFCSRGFYDWSWNL